ncbi:MAG: hypothetical protein ACO3LF_07730 [Candidatus Kariarchaeum pelagius]
MSNKKITLGARYTLDMGQPVTLIPKRVLTEGIECEYVMSSPGRKEIIQFDIWEMNGFDVSDYSLMWMDTDMDTGRVKEDDELTKWNQKRLNAIKEVIQWIDSGKQDLNNGIEEIDFIINEWNYGENKN